MAAVKIPVGKKPNTTEKGIVRGLQPHSSKTHNPRATNSRSIKNVLDGIHDEPAPAELLTAFRKYWPGIRQMSMKEAWLRTVYMEAVAGQPWASFFVADRTEGKIGEGGLSNGKGKILEAIDTMMDQPVSEGGVE